MSRELDLFGPSTLTYRVTSRDLEVEDLFVEVMVLKFVGDYQVGSRGNPDADFMVAILGAALSRLGPDAVVFDLTELAYQWGNSLLRIFDCLDRWDSEDPIGCAIAGGPGSLAGLESLLTPAGSSRPALLQEDLESAVQHALPGAIERARKIG